MYIYITLLISTSIVITHTTMKNVVLLVILIVLINILAVIPLSKQAVCGKRWCCLKASAPLA